MSIPLLKANSISKSFFGVQALKNVTFELLEGEVHALIGENGAGKSTLIKTITGAIAADSGTLEVRGKPVPHNNPGVARALGIAAIYQQPSLFPDLSVAENIALTLEGAGLWRRVNWKERRRRAVELIDRTGTSIHPDRRVSSLSMPEQQIVEIARAIGADVKILLMDEPTASLTDLEAQNLFKIIALLRGQGAGIIYISHRLEEVSTVADRITVLRDGEAIATRSHDEVDKTSLIEMMVGREISAVSAKRNVEKGDVVFELRAVCNRVQGLRDISLSVRRGEILGLAGLVGSGRTELAETLFGLTPAGSGEIRMHGTPTRITTPAQAIGLGIGYVPEDRRRHGVVLEMPICANTSLASLDRVSRRGLIDGRQERLLAGSYMRQLRIKAPSIHTETGSLSGGNQQKVALARWLAIEPKVLILDEPTQGVDVGSKFEIHGLLMDLAERGLAIIMISSELPEILAMSDRIAVMHRGTIDGILNREEATQQKILSLALGHGPGGDMARIH
jgi:rhamnose transport system ATP-binding protein